jgi:tetratricopeptide (TPR) repeat protein
VDALVDVLETSDAATLASAVQAVAGLRPVSSCGDPAALMDEQRRLGMPTDPAAAAEVSRLQRMLAQVEALYLSGRLDGAIALADRAIHAARALAYLPLVAEALFWRGRILADTSAADEAASSLWAAYLTSVGCGHEAIELRSLIADVHVRGYGLRDFATASRSAEIARALIARTSPDVDVQSEFFNNLANVHVAQGRLAEAEQVYNAGLAIHRGQDEKETVRMGMLFVGLGETLREQGRLGESTAASSEAIRIFSEHLGPRHLFTFMAQANLALAHLETGDMNAFERLFEPAFVALVTGFGADRPDLALFYEASGALNLARGAVQKAFLDLETACELAGRLGQPTVRAHVRFALARALWDHRPFERARALTLARQAGHDAHAYDLRERDPIDAWLASHEGFRRESGQD